VRVTWNLGPSIFFVRKKYWRELTSGPPIRGSREHPRRWIRCLRAIGTTTNIFHDFCDYMCMDIETNNIPGTDFHWVFIWDNLTAHHSASTQ
jgi:hypothetical protein